MPYCYEMIGWSYYLWQQSGAGPQTSDEALAALNKALELEPDRSSVHSDLGQIYYFQGDYDRALPFLERANQLDPNLAEPYLGLGSVYQLQGKNAEAVAALNKYLELSDDPQWRAQAEQMLQDLGAGQ